MEATLRELRAQHLAAVEHRATVASTSQETSQAKARMITAQRLAEVARDRLAGADGDLRAKVLAMLDVRAEVVNHDAGTQIKLTGSVAHDLLMAGIEGPAPAVLARTGRSTSASTSSAPATPTTSSRSDP